MHLKAVSRNLTLLGAQNPQQLTSSFTFALIADPQLGLFRNNHSWEEELLQVKECITSAASLEPKPAFIAILGDLVHAPVPAQSHGPDAEEIRCVRDEQASALMDAIDKPSKDIPVLTIPGNHDIGATPTREAIADYEQLWGKDYFRFWFGGVKFVLANSSIFYDDLETSKEAEEQFAWIEGEFKDAVAKGAKHIFLMQHHQFYWKHWEEEDDTTTTIEVRQMKTQNLVSFFQIPAKWRMRFLPLLKKYKISASFHGHLHSESIITDQGTPQIVLTASGFATNGSRPGWVLVKVSEKDFEHKFFPVEWRAKTYPFMPPRFS